MYINSGAYLQKHQIGLDLGNLLDLGGLLEEMQDTKTDLGNSPFLRGVRAKPVVFFLWIRTRQRQGPYGDH
jgi:hypothetical protein